MHVSLAWLRQLSGVDADPQQVAERLTDGGLEVEGIVARGRGLDEIVVARVVAARPHPERERLQLVRVHDGHEELEVVCGASNVPAAGGRVVLARVGARLPDGLEIGERSLGGHVSRGMLCSEVELDVGSGADGILVLGDDVPAEPGTGICEALGLEDTILALSITPNRPDCLGHIGLARELCALFDASLPPQLAMAERLARPSQSMVAAAEPTFALARMLTPAPTKKVAVDVSTHAPVRVAIRDSQRCPRYAAAFVLGVQIAPSPFAVRYRLHVLGIRAINNVVDATNLVLMGFGHPIHAFDLSALEGRQIEVRLAQEGERLRTLDGNDRVMTADDLLICDDTRPVALAGVMGGETSEVTSGTRDVLIECAYFDPRTVRRTARRHNLHTDSSYRFERGVDPNAVPQVLAHAAAFIANLGGGAVVPTGVDVYPAPVRPCSIVLPQRRLESLLGVRVPSEAVSGIFDRLGFGTTETAEGWRVTVPAFRPDITRDVDLVEEVARVRGYHTIPTELPRVRSSADSSSPTPLAFVRRLRESAVAAGLDECVNFSFVAARDLEAARVSTHAVVLRNPLSEERAVLRTSLLPGLAANLRRAQHHQQRRMAAFEVARTFAPSEPGSLPEERYEFGMLVAGPRQAWLGEGPDMDFYDGKGFLQAATRVATGYPVETIVDAEPEHEAPWLHPRRKAALVMGGRKLGYLGELHPDVVEALGLEGRPVYGHVDVQALQEASAVLGAPRAQPLPRFPAVTRDIAVVVDETQWAGEVAAVLREAGGSLVDDVELFDIYHGEPVASGQKSLAFRVTYRDPEATLTDAQVDRSHGNVVRAAEDRFQARIR